MYMIGGKFNQKVIFPSHIVLFRSFVIGYCITDLSYSLYNMNWTRTKRCESALKQGVIVIILVEMQHY